MTYSTGFSIDLQKLVYHIGKMDGIKRGSLGEGDNVGCKWTVVKGVVSLKTYH